MNILVCADFFDGIRDVRSGSVDMVFADLPYGGRFLGFELDPVMAFKARLRLGVAA